MNLLKFKSLIWLMAGVLVISACKKDEEEEIKDPTLAVSSIKTTDGTDLYGATSATTVGTDQNILIGFSAAVDANSLTNVKLKNGDNTVASSVTASGSTVTIDPTDALFGGTVYTVEIKDVKSTEGATSGNVSTTFTTAGIGLGTAPQADAQILYMQLNDNTLDVTGNNTASVSQVTYTEDRFGEANSAAHFSGATEPGNGDLIVMEGSSFVNPSTTISVWFKLDHADFPEGTSRSLFGSAAQLGFFCELGNNLDWMKMATDHVISPDPADHQFATAWGDDINGGGNIGGNVLVQYLGSISDVISSNTWHQMVMSYDNSSSVKAVYIDGALIAKYDLNNNEDEGAEWNMTDMAYFTAPAGFDAKLGIGFSASNLNTVDDWNNYAMATNTFIGSVDDFRIWKVGLTQEQVFALYDAEKP